MCFKTEEPAQLESTNAKRVLGLDFGIHNIVAGSDGQIVSNAKRNCVKRKHAYLRACLQAKGTPSARRHLRCLSGKEARFSLNENHVLAKQIANLDYHTFVIEDLTNIRKNAKTWSKSLNRKFANWTFAQLQFFLEYKSIALGKKVVKVDPKYTSQTCNVCGHVEQANRVKSKFSCKSCGHSDHADLNAAKNIRDKFLAASTKPAKQVAVKQPNVLDL